MSESFRVALVFSLFALAVLIVITRPWGISEAAPMLAGACAMVVAGLVPAAQAMRLLFGSWDVLLFFVGLITVAWAVEEAGLSGWIAHYAARQSHGHARRLLINVFGAGVLISTFLSNDAAALLLTPVVVAVARETDLPVLPLALACTFIADTASVTLPVSNPINLLFLQSFPDIHFASYLAHLLAPSLAAIGVNVIAFLFVFRAALPARFVPLQTSGAPESPQTTPFFVHAAVAVCALSLAYVVAAIVGWPLGLVAVAGGAVLLAGGLATHGIELERIVQAPWAVVPFVAGLLIMVQGLENAGITAWLGGLLASVSAHGPLAGTAAVVFGGAIGANALNNLPAATVLSNSIAHAAVQPRVRDDLAYAGIFGSDIGPNLTVVGSLSTTLWLLLLRRRGIRVTGWQYLRTGVIVTIPMLLVGTVLLAALR